MQKSNFNLSNYALFKEGFSKASWLSRLLSLIWQKNISEKDITYIDIEVSINLKTNRYDILALVGKEDYIRVNVEMQNNDYDYLTTRMENYHSRLMNNEFEKGKGYNTHKCKSIWLINFKTNKFGTNWYNRYIYYNPDSSIELNHRDNSIIVINLNYIDKSNIMELIEFTYLFTHSYDECKDKKFKFDFTKEGFELMEKINVKDESLQWQAFQALDYEKEQYEAEKTKQELEELKKANIEAKLELEETKIRAKLELEETKLQSKKELEDANKRAKQVEANAEDNKRNMIISMYKNNIDINTISKIINLSVSEVENIIK